MKEKLKISLFAVLVVAFFLGSFFAPKMGKYVMVDEILFTFILFVISGFPLLISVPLILSEHFAPAEVKMKILIVSVCIISIAMMVFVLSSTVDIVLDLARGTEEIEIIDLDFYVKIRSGRRNIRPTTYEVKGTNTKTGKRDKYILTEDVYRQYRREDVLFLEVYTRTKRVVACHK